MFTCGDMPYGRAKNPEVVERVQRGQILQRPSACPYEVYEVGSNGNLNTMINVRLITQNNL